MRERARAGRVRRQETLPARPCGSEFRRGKPFDRMRKITCPGADDSHKCACASEENKRIRIFSSVFIGQTILEKQEGFLQLLVFNFSGKRKIQIFSGLWSIKERKGLVFCEFYQD